MLLAILLTIQILVSVSMAGLILIQRSEGGALGMGGGPSGFMSARGAGNLLTKATSVLAFIFFINCVGLTIAFNYSQRAVSAVDKVDTSGLTVTPSTQPVAPAAPQTTGAPVPSLSDLPLDSGTPASSAAAPALTPLAPASTSASSAAKPVAQKPAAKPATSSSAAPVTAAPAASSATTSPAQ